MNDQLQNKLTEVLTSAQAVGADAYEFVKAQAPVLAEEIIKWRVVELYMNAACSLLAVIAGLILCPLCVWCYRRQAKSNDIDGPFLGMLASSVCIVAFLIVGSCQLASSSKSLIQAKVAPRVFFIQTCSELLKK